jgi:hypothetical protein
MAKAFVKLDLKPLRKFSRGLHDGLNNGTGPFGKMMEKWGLRYLTFLQRKFRENSGGGGGWKPLSPKTLEKEHPKTRAGILPRGSPHFVRRIGILRISGAIYRSLFKGESGNLFRRVGNKLQVGVGGPGRHPNADGMTVAGLVMIHNNGATMKDHSIPRRPIILEPDAATVAAMKQDVAPAVQDMLRRAS